MDVRWVLYVVVFLMAQAIAKTNYMLDEMITLCVGFVTGIRIVGYRWW